ncbi:Oleuropein beta-glucosidase [Sesamum angolense]|uniref:Oleuropein beta-glucosidase n=1 Tax=Sesamum angolense TaxID=2727404 RepID=A0AAE2BKJ0_9LAMI|nr:Oleuropein beta-glucosidase [Sesamum angolense]
MESSKSVAVLHSPADYEDEFNEYLNSKGHHDNSHITRNDFPPNFLFGTATSAYQFEGGAAKGGRGPSIWDTFALKTPGRVADGSNGNVATDLYARFEEDITMMKKMGFDAYRFSISWPRILPGGRCCAGVNQEGIDFYNNVIDTLIQHEIEPYVTLFHWDLPQCLQDEYDGFLSKRVVDDFREFAELCFWEYGDRVKNWTTLNEPTTYSIQGYASCTFPPSQAPSPTFLTALISSVKDFFHDHPALQDFDITSIPASFRSALASLLHSYSSDSYQDGTNVVAYRGVFEPKQLLSTFLYDDTRTNYSNYSLKPKPDQAKDVYIVGRNMLLAHAAAEHQEGKIGITLVTHWLEPLNNRDPDDIKAAKRGVDFMLGWFLEPIVSGNYPQSMIDNVPPENLAPFTKSESEMVKGSYDFLGLNYYTANYASNDPDPDCADGYFKDQHIKLHIPWGIYKLLKHTKETYKNLPPIYITENGVDERSNHKHTAQQACDDTMRVNYYQQHLAYVRKAIDEHVDVRGFFAWSWCDNFEWTEGYSVRFGIMYVDFKNDLRRYPKKSALWFSKFLKGKKKLIVNAKKRQNTNATDDLDADYN